MPGSFQAPPPWFHINYVLCIVSILIRNHSLTLLRKMATASELTSNQEEAHLLPITPQEVDPKAVFKAGLLPILVTVSGTLNPLLISAAATAQEFHADILSDAFHLTTFVCLVIGVLQILLSTVLHEVPGLLSVAKRLTRLGFISVRITLGFGSSLVMLEASSAWSMLFLFFFFLCNTYKGLCTLAYKSVE